MNRSKTEISTRNDIEMLVVITSNVFDSMLCRDTTRVLVLLWLQSFSSYDQNRWQKLVGENRNRFNRFLGYPKRGIKVVFSDNTFFEVSFSVFSTRAKTSTQTHHFQPSKPKPTTTMHAQHTSPAQTPPPTSPNTILHVTYSKCSDSKQHCHKDHRINMSTPPSSTGGGDALDWKFFQVFGSTNQEEVADGMQWCW